MLPQYQSILHLKHIMNRNVLLGVFITLVALGVKISIFANIDTSPDPVDFKQWVI